MFRAQTVLTELGLDATSRLKTTNTIIEKLRRERTRLARDAGYRRTADCFRHGPGRAG
jgi:ppGpp synthetase/RelA/SpoT-type nucleotidyltranferase